MPLIVDETTTLGLSIELPINRTRGDLSWLTSLSSLALENPKMDLSCLVFLFQKPVIFPFPIYALLGSLCADLNQNDLNMQCMPVASFGGWELAKPMSLTAANDDLAAGAAKRRTIALRASASFIEFVRSSEDGPTRSAWRHSSRSSRAGPPAGLCRGGGQWSGPCRDGVLTAAHGGRISELAGLTARPTGIRGHAEHACSAAASNTSDSRHRRTVLLHCAQGVAGLASDSGHSRPAAPVSASDPQAHGRGRPKRSHFERRLPVRS